MSLAASFLPSVAFALRASRVAALLLLTHAAAQAGWFERLAGQFIILPLSPLLPIITVDQLFVDGQDRKQKEK